MLVNPFALVSQLTVLPIIINTNYDTIFQMLEGMGLLLVFHSLWILICIWVFTTQLSTKGWWALQQSWILWSCRRNLLLGPIHSSIQFLLLTNRNTQMIQSTHILAKALVCSHSFRCWSFIWGKQPACSQKSRLKSERAWISWGWLLKTITVHGF